VQASGMVRVGLVSWAYGEEYFIACLADTGF
jgi:hypothetical protein